MAPPSQTFCTFLKDLLHHCLRLLHHTQFRRRVSDHSVALAASYSSDTVFDEDDIFSPPSFDGHIYYDDNMPPIFDDYIDNSGFGRVPTLGNDPTIF